MKKNLMTLCLLLASVLAAAVEPIDYDQIVRMVNSAGTKWKAGPPTDTALGILGVFGSWRSSRRPASISYTITKIPDHFDSRERWPHCPSIREVRNQGRCGSCWAVAAASTLSDRFCIATNGTFVLPLSAEELLSCCSWCGGCGGGSHDKAWDYFRSDGLVTGGGFGSNVGCQPYEVPPCERTDNTSLPSCKSLKPVKTPECKRKCTNPSYEVPYSSDHRKTKSSYRLPNNVTQIQSEILTRGPVEASMILYSDFATYKSGIYHHMTLQVVSSHAVKIVGWGSQKGTPYWIVSNTFDVDWGEQGFFRILRGVNECGIEDDASGGEPLVL